MPSPEVWVAAWNSATCALPSLFGGPLSVSLTPPVWSAAQALLYRTDAVATQAREWWLDGRTDANDGGDRARPRATPALRQHLDRAYSITSAVLAIVGVVNVPIVKYSVNWWNSLHQPASVLRPDGPAVAPAMLWPLLVAALGYTCYFGWIMLTRARAEVLRRDRGGNWVREALGEGVGG